MPDLMNLMYFHWFFRLTTKLICVSNTVATLIYYIWTIKPGSNIKNRIISTNITDHFPIFSHFLVNSIYQKHEYVYRRSFPHVNINNSITKRNANLESTLKIYDPKEAFEIFSELYNDNFQQCLPIKKVKVNVKYNRRPHIINRLKTSITENTD